MTGNFRLVRKISFNLPGYSSLPLVFTDVYVDRFNSVFKGFYLLVSAESVTVEHIEKTQQIVFTKVRSTERFGAGLRASDIVAADIVARNELTTEELRIINYLNKSINSNFYRVTE